MDWVGGWCGWWWIYCKWVGGVSGACGLCVVSELVVMTCRRRPGSVVVCTMKGIVSGEWLVKVFLHIPVRDCLQMVFVV